jgi:protein SCO1/2
LQTNAQSELAPQIQRNVPSRNLLWTSFIVLVIALLIGGWALWNRFGPRPAPQFGVPVNASKAIADFRLDSTLGHPVALSDFADRYLVVYFGYTTCPDVCPTTLADLGKAEKLLGREAQRIQMLFITVDPERDTIERMRDYLAFFGPNFIGLRGSLEETETIASQFGVVYQKQFHSASATDYLMDHSAAVIVLDPQRRPLVLFPYGVSAEQLASDLKRVIR